MRSTKGFPRWVTWLPMVVVTLPTVCLLWFMGQAVRNERLAVKQRLVDAYRRTLADTRAKTEQRWAAIHDALAADLPTEPAPIFKALMSSPPDVRDLGSPLEVQALILCGESSQIVYPRVDPSDLAQGLAVESSEVFQEAWQAEYVLSNPSDAAARYQQVALQNPDPNVQVMAAMGAVRCLVKSGQVPQAVAVGQRVLTESRPVESPVLAASLLSLRIQVVQVLRDARLPAYAQEARDLLLGALDYQTLSLPSQTRAFVLAKAVELLPQDLAQGPLQAEVRTAQTLREAEVASLQVMEQASSVEGLANTIVWSPPGSVRPLPAGGLFGCLVLHGDHRLVLAMDRARLARCLAALIRPDIPESLGFRLLDSKGQADQEIDPEATIVGTSPVGAFLPGWGMEVFLKGDSLFDEAARRQQAMYIWIGTLVIVLILLAAALGTQMIHRQIRLGRLKNDFIATVTHELKTPLASMRVLVDTLIEGRTRDSQQASEYLHLVAKENVRLTGLIDNFLTFSRMERNKQAFTIVPTDAAAIARDAAEAVRTRFGMAECRFQVRLEDGLPQVLADHEAMVTVLVNLLDNACKYTGEHKEISLRVWAESAGVCFSVSDNGVGIPRRALRRVFDKFYQVDQTLSRRAGGCGLGLAIVKFVVDAHQGRVFVESRVDEGSTFTVRLPCAGPG